jgi:TPR repeat protein
MRVAGRTRVYGIGLTGLLLFAGSCGPWSEAVKGLERRAAGGDPKDQYQLGQLYEVDRGHMYRWLSRASAALAPSATSEESFPWVPPDDAKAAHWYRQAALRGHLHAQVRLASMYLDGRGVAQDSFEAFIWFGRAERRARGKIRDLARAGQETAGQVLSDYQRDQGRGLAREWTPIEGPVKP